MHYTQFFTQLLGFSLFVILILLGLQYIIPALQPYQDISWLSCVLFIALTLFAYFGGLWTIASSNKNLFTGFMFLFIGSKMMLSVILVISYNKFALPTSKIFILPFFLVYLFYTIFELHILTKLSKMDDENIDYH